MLPFLVTLCMFVQLTNSQNCCPEKTLSGGELSGTYQFVKTMSSGSYPSECQDGCSYTKDGDTSVHYCFSGSGSYSFTCNTGSPTTAGSPSGSNSGGGVGTQDEYCAIASDHTMCLHTGPSDTCAAKTVHRDFTSTAKQAIVDKHNELRAKVARGEETNGNQPGASNMKKLVWNDELAVIAQRWADQCSFDHDTNRQKTDGIWVGQNLYLKASSNQATYDELMAAMPEEGSLSWYNEVVSPGFNANNVNPFVFDSGAGHYTQVVWAETDEIGCGYTYFSEKIGPFDAYKSLVVCNYGIGGNAAGKPMYKIGATCSACEEGYTCDGDLCAKN